MTSSARPTLLTTLDGCFFKDVLPVEPGFSKAERVSSKAGKESSPQSADYCTTGVAELLRRLRKIRRRAHHLTAALDLPVSLAASPNQDSKDEKQMISKRAFISCAAVISIFISILTPHTFAQRMVFDDWTAVQALTPGDEVIVTLKTEKE